MSKRKSASVTLDKQDSKKQRQTRLPDRRLTEVELKEVFDFTVAHTEDWKAVRDRFLPIVDTEGIRLVKIKTLYDSGFGERVKYEYAWCTQQELDVMEKSEFTWNHHDLSESPLHFENLVIYTEALEIADVVATVNTRGEDKIEMDLDLLSDPERPDGLSNDKWREKQMAFIEALEEAQDHPAGGGSKSARVHRLLANLKTL